jgi:hypothetical protein
MNQSGMLKFPPQEGTEIAKTQNSNDTDSPVDFLRSGDLNW